MSSHNFPELLEAFFTERLMHQRQASEHTIASYRDTFCLIFSFALQQLKKAPSELSIEDLNAPFIVEFLHHLEEERKNSSRTRNVRLAAIHSFFKYIALREPKHSALIQRVLAIPSKRYTRKAIEFLTRQEIDALLAAPDQNTWTGRRDQTLLLLAVQTGLRVSELIALQRQDVVIGTRGHVRCIGKGRKERCVPLRKETLKALKSWLEENKSSPNDRVFTNARGGSLSRDGVEYLLAKHLSVARKQCPSLEKKPVSPHVLRHSAAMDLLNHGVDRTVIALWLGHESVETTQIYIHASLELKEKALARTAPLDVQPGRYRPDDKLLRFLKSL